MSSPDTDSSKTPEKRKKESTPSFLLEANFLRDPKVRRLRLKHGMEGVGIWMAIVGDLRLNGLTLAADYLTDLQEELNILRDVFEQVLNTCLNIDLLQRDSAQNVTCRALSERIDSYDRIRAKRIAAGQKSGRIRRLKQRTKGRTNLEHTSNAVATPPTKLNQTKYNQNKDLDLRDLITPDLNTPEVLTALELWRDNRRDIKKPLTVTNIKAICQKYAGRPHELVRDIHHSAAGAYQGLFSPNGATTPNGTPLTKSDIRRKASDEHIEKIKRGEV